MHPFVQGQDYSRSDIFSVISIPEQKGGDWFTGYTEFEGDFFIFCGVGTAGRTGHDYPNYFEGDELVWVGKTHSNTTTPRVQRLLSPGTVVYVFFREDNRDPFTFAGIGSPIQVEETTPVKVRWRFTGVQAPSIITIPEEIPSSQQVREGAKKTISVNIYERNPSARRQCIAHWGTTCQVCSFDFEKVYGNLGKGFIHVHHLKPLGEIGGSYLLDPINDLRPVCPNCHAMLHRSDPALGIDQLKRGLN
jgi:5-methylcytosine-specific restriction protein A